MSGGLSSTKPAGRASDTYKNVSSTPATSSGDGIEAIEELTRPAASRKDTSSRTRATPSRTEVYAAVDLAHARRRLTAFHQCCAEAEVPELTRLARTIAAWQDEVIAYHYTSTHRGSERATMAGAKP